MRYYDFLESNKKEVMEQLEYLFTKYKVQPVGYGYIDCIIMKDKLEEYIKEISKIGILITNSSWWCYVNSNSSESTGCPHGMGGSSSIYYGGWFSELQNAFFEADDKNINKILNSYDKELIYSLNMEALAGINNMLKEPFKYTPNDYIMENKCVMPGLWLLVPDNWKREKVSTK